MYRVKMRMLSLLLAVTILCGVMPVTVAAETTKETVGETATVSEYSAGAAKTATKEVIEPTYTPSTQKEARCVPLMLQQEYWHQGELTETNWHTLYNPETASMMVDLAEASTLMGKGGDWESVMEEYGYGQLYNTYNNVTYKTGQYRLGWRLLGELEQPIWFPAVNALIGIQEVVYNGQTRYAVGIVFRGSSDLQDWLADFTAYSDEEGYHEGFSQNAEYFYEVLSKEVIFHVGNKYYSLYEIYEKMQEPNSEFCMLVMGHSLGAALTNVLVGRYLYEGGVHPSNLAAYAFATPLTAPSSKVEEYPYNNIYNIINADDLVPAITLAGHERFGEDLVYYPTDQFRLTHYDKDYVENHLEESNGFWRSVGFLGTLGKPHLIDASYRDIVASVSADIAASTAEETHYTTYSTCGYNDWWLADAVITPYTFGNLTGDLHTGGALRFRGGVLQVRGNFDTSGGLFMNHENDYLKVSGDIDISWGVPGDSSEHLTAGTVEAKGDFRVDDGWYEYAYRSTGSHRTVFSGTRVQTITVTDSDSGFANLYIRNSMVDFGWAVPYICLAEDALITSTEALNVWTLDLNGHSLGQAGTLSVNSLTMGGGTLEAAGDASIHTIKTMDGQMAIHGNLDLTSTLPFDGGKMWVDGDCYLPSTLIMQDENDYFCVGGTLTVYARDFDNIPDDHLSAGTVELKGDLEFDDCGICTENGYRETGTHKTILSGTQPQTIWFNRAGEANRFENLCIRNEQASLYMLNDVRLAEDARIVITGDNRERRMDINGTLDTAGYTFAVDASGWTNTDYRPVEVNDLKGGTLQVDGDVYLTSGTVTGNLVVTGDLTVDNTLTFACASIEVGGDCETGASLIMQNDADYLLVGGNLKLDTNKYIPMSENHLCAGTIELKGNLDVPGGSDRRSYQASGTHKTIFSGDGTQTVSMGAMYDHKIVQACLRNPNVIFTSIYTLRLMEDAALANPSACNIYGNLDLNGYKLVAQGDFGLLRGNTGNNDLIQIKVEEETEKTPASLTISCPVEMVEEETIYVLVTGYDEFHRMRVCEVVTFTSESEMTAKLSKENWPECTETHVFWLEGDFVPFCSAMSLTW